MSATDSTYSTTEVAKKTGATLRQLQWWDEEGLIEATMDGHNRVYDNAKLREVTVLVALRRRGVSLQRSRRILRSIRAKALNQPERTIYATDGLRTYIGTKADDALTAILGMKTKSLVICDVPGVVAKT